MTDREHGAAIVESVLGEPREIGPTAGHVPDHNDVILEALEREIDEGPAKVARLEGRPLTPAEKDYEMRFMSQICNELDIRLRREHSMRCPQFFIESQGFGYRFNAYDRDGRLFIVDYKTEFALELPSAKSGGENIGREMIDDILKRVLAARDEYMRRMVS